MPDEKDEKEGREERGSEPDRKWWAEMARDVAATGLATIFMTEDSVRNYLKEKKLPKELISPLLDGLSKKKDDFYGLVANEVGRVLSKIDVSKEVGKFLEKHKIHFEAKVSFEPKASSEEAQESKEST